MRAVAGPLRDLAPDVALAGLALAALLGAGAALGVPLTLYLGLVTVTLGMMYLGRRVLGPASRTAVETLATGVIVYASGWGPALGLAFVAPLVQAVGRGGPRAVRPAVGTALVTIGSGQAATHLGWAPTFVATAAGHGVAAVGALALVAVARRLHRTVVARELAEQSLRHSRERYRALVQHSTDVVVVLDDEGRIVEQGPAVTASLGYATHALDGAGYATLAHPDDAPRVTEALCALVAGGALGLTDARLRRVDGSYVPVEIAWSDLRSHPAVRALVAHARDVSERRQLEAALEHRAFHDELTDLANRAKFTDRVEHAVARSGRRPQRIAVMFLDLDGFKHVNDTLGHEAGDALLAEVADRLREAVRDVDTPARLGGDEFAVLLEDLRDESDAVRVAQRVLAGIRRPIELDGQPVHIDGSVGVAVWSGIESASQLLRNADIAMYSAKNGGKGRYEVFEPAMHVRAVERLELERELAAAIGRDLVLHHEPIFALDDDLVVGVEALVHWRHPRRGLLAPAEFLPFAEESGLVVPLGRWVLTTACREVAAWQQRYRPRRDPLGLKIGIAAEQVLSGDLVADVARALAASGLEPGSLTLGITGAAMIQDDAATLHALRELRYLGVRLAIDGFGVGYLGLGTLQQLPVDELRIDRSFVSGLTDGTQDPALVRAIIDISRSLQLRTVADGVDHAEQAARLHGLGCELGQGRLLGWAADAATTERLLSTRLRCVLDELVDGTVSL
ncbi:MAG TPA: EAL domain-containing protein [Nitriliruptorales bacterium]